MVEDIVTFYLRMLRTCQTNRVKLMVAYRLCGHRPHREPPRGHLATAAAHF